MTHWLKHAAALLGLGLIFTPALAQQTITPAPAFSIAELTSSQEDGWITNGGTLSNQRYSPLDQINRDNVSELKGVWRVGLDSALDFRHNNQAQPLVYEGVIYIVTGQDDVFAISVDTGEILWEYRSGLTEDDAFICCGWVSRGLGMGEGKLFLGRVDARLMALDMQTGAVLWDIQDVLPEDGYSLTAAPLYYDGMVITGYSGGDLGTRGRVKAYDVDNGTEIWTFYTIPGPGEFGHDTWPANSDAWMYGGAPVWNAPALDPELDMIYFTTGNAYPTFNGDARPGDNLFTASIVALDAHTGEYRWHFQEIHHDIWDYDSPNPVILFDAEIDGVMRRGLAQIPKTGYLYILDRITGEPIFEVNEVPVPQEPGRATSPTQPIPAGEPILPHTIDIAPEGWPLVNEGRTFTPLPMAGRVIYRPLSHVNWNPSAYDPQSHLMYICATDQIGALVANPRNSAPDYVTVEHTDTFGSTGIPRRGIYTAVDLTSREIAWQQQWPDRCFSGSTVTAGGLVFIGRNDGRLTAMNSSTGELLWEFQTETGIHQSVTVFEYNGTQYVAAFAGGTIYAPNSPGDSLWLFSLDGTMGPVVAGEAAQDADGMSAAALLASLPEQPADTAAGRTQYIQSCAPCHGETGEGGEGGGAPLTGGLGLGDLLSVVFNGRNNMPAFGSSLTAGQLKDLGSYITEDLVPR